MYTHAHTLECSLSGDFYESHCGCLSASTAIFLIHLLSPQPGCICRFFFPPHNISHFSPYAAGSGSLLVNIEPSFNLNPSRSPPLLPAPLRSAPAACWGSRGQSTTDRLTPRFIVTQMFMEVRRHQKGGSCLRGLLEIACGARGNNGRHV